MPVTLTKVNESTTRTTFLDLGTMAITGTYAAGGIAVDWTQQLNAGGKPNPNGSASSTVPLQVIITSQGAAATFFDYRWNKTANKIQAFAAGAEVAAGTVPAGVSADVIVYRAEFLKD